MNKLTIALALSTAICAAAATHLWQSLGDERAQRAALQTQLTQLENAFAQASAAPTHAPDPLPVIEVAPPPTTDPPPQMQAVITSPAPMGMGRSRAPDPEMLRRMQQSHEQQLRLLNDPEYRELMRTQQRAGMQQVYADLKPLLGLSDAESERLLDLLAEHSLRNMEQPRAMFGPRNAMTPDDPNIRERQRLMQEQRQRNEAEIAALLGPNKYQQWQEYQQNGWPRSQVTRLRHTLALSDEPLRQDQIKPLVDVMAREQKQLAAATPPRNMVGGRPSAEMQARWVEDMVERIRQSHDRIRIAASGLLSPSQYEQLLRQQEQEIRTQELSARQQRARADAQARGELPDDSVGSFTAFPPP